MKFKHLESVDKLRGGFYTPLALADMLSRWAFSGGGFRVLEPGCGDGSFLKSICKVVDKQVVSKLNIDGVELLREEAEKAKHQAACLENRGAKVTIHETDFLGWVVSKPLSTTWDIIIGNPPYIRYQYFDTTQRDHAENIFKQAGVPFTKLTNAWVPFVIASIMHLSPNGRLAMVLPEELLHILHATGLRNILQQEMAQLDIVDIRELAFDDALQGVILLRAVKKERSFIPLHPSWKNQDLQPMLIDLNGNTDNPAPVNIRHLNNIEDLDSLSSLSENKNPGWVPNGKWTQKLLTDKELNLLKKIEKNGGIELFKDIANVDIGIVTGANKYFVVDRTTAEKYELWDIVSPMLARSEFIKGITYTKDDQEQNEIEGKAVLFLQFPKKPKEELPQKMAEYINLGEKQELHTRYKCRIRTPWYVVPYVWKSNIGLLKRCHDFPRLVLNELGALSTDTAYRIVMNQGYEQSEKDFVFSFINSLTFLYAELEGRHYGGGVLELVPSEIEKLRIPLTQITQEQFSKLDKMIRDGISIENILDFTDPILLGPGTANNLSQDEIDLIRTARNRLRDRRMRLGLKSTGE